MIAALSRTQLADVDRCYEALRDAERSRIHVFISTSPSHMEHMLKMNEAQVLDEVRQGVARAREHTGDVEFSPQDATRTPLDFMLEVLAAAVEAGATTSNIPDTVGYGIPWDFGDLITHVREQIAGDYVISTHCHNDLGLAVANSLSGVRAGARQVEVCVNGLGERAGNAALEEVVMALKIRPDQFPGLETNVQHRGARPDEPARGSRLTGYQVQWNKAVVGKNAFAHESGIHQHGVLDGALDLRDHRRRLGRPGRRPDRARQAHGPPRLRGHPGRSSASSPTATPSTPPSPASRSWPTARCSSPTPTSRRSSPRSSGRRSRRASRSTCSRSRAARSGMPRARVVVSRDGRKSEATAEGDGMIDAACKAIKQATGIEAKLTDFNVSSVTGGIDALGDVVIQLEADGVRASGRGLSTDVVEAAARAYLAATNRVVRAKARIAAWRGRRSPGRGDPLTGPHEVFVG